MCRPHWYLVPAALRRKVWDAWDGGLGTDSPAYREAVRTAIRAVNIRLAKEASDAR